MKRDDVRDSILSAQNAQGEAVAWMAIHPGIGDVVLFTEFPQNYADAGVQVTPLYTHAERARVPELDAEDWKVLQRLRNALPDVGLNDWHRGVTVLSKILSAAPSQPEGGEVGL